MKYKVAFLFDKNNDWIVSFYKKYNFNLNNFLINSFFDSEEIKDFDIVFIIGYTKFFKSIFAKKSIKFSYS